MPVTLDQVKKHLELEGVTGEDGYLGALLAAASRAVELKTNRTISGDAPTLTGADLALAEQAMLLLVGTWYTNREGATTDARSLPAEVPLSVTWILAPLKRWDDGCEGEPV
jgi:hypothetical protein